MLLVLLLVGGGVRVGVRYSTVLDTVLYCTVQYYCCGVVVQYVIYCTYSTVLCTVCTVLQGYNYEENRTLVPRVLYCIYYSIIQFTV